MRKNSKSNKFNDAGYKIQSEKNKYLLETFVEIFVRNICYMSIQNIHYPLKIK